MIPEHHEHESPRRSCLRWIGIVLGLTAVVVLACLGALSADRGEVRTGAVLGWCVGLLVLLGFVLAYGGHLNNVIGGQ